MYFLKVPAGDSGVWYSRPGNGVSHPVHQQMFGRPGKTLLGSDSHTPAAGAIGILAIGAGGLEVALAMAGEPFYFKMPKVWGIRLLGQLPDWVSSKDIILEMLRRHDVDGAVGYVLEYYGPGLETLSAYGPARNRQHGNGTWGHCNRVPIRPRSAAFPEESKSCG